MAAGVTNKMYQSGYNGLTTNLQNQNASDVQNAADARNRVTNLQDMQTANLGSYGEMVQNYMKNASGLLATPGYTDAEKAGMTSSTLNPIAGSYAAAEGANRNASAVTNNPAVAAAQRGVLARAKAQQLSTAAGGLQKSFGDARIAGTNTAMGDLSTGINAFSFIPQQQQQMANTQAGMYGTATGNETANNNTQAGLVNNQGNLAAQGGFWSQLAKNAVGGAASAITKKYLPAA